MNQNIDWNLNHLSAFLALAKTLHFTQAARELGVSQPNVSRQVRALEEKLGSQLFIRTQRKVVLSETGRQLFARLSSPLSQIQEALRDAAEGARELSGRIHVGSLTEIGQSLLFPLLTDFGRLHPKVELELVYLPSAEILARLKDGRLDFGLLATATEDESLRFYPALEESFALVSGPETPPLGKKQRGDFVTYRRNDPVLNAFLRQNKRVLPLTGHREILTVNSHRSMAEALCELPAYAVMPIPGAQILIEKHRLKVLFHARGKTKLYLAHREDDFMSHKLKALREHLLTQLRQAQRANSP